MDEQQRSRRFTLLLVLALMLSSGWLGLHFAGRASDRAPEPYPRVVLLPR